MNRQRLVLAGLLIVLVLAIISSVVRFPRQQAAQQAAIPTGQGATGTRGGAAAADTRVRLDLLRKDQARFTGFRKNIFAPIFRDLGKLPPVKPVIPAPPPPPPPPVAAGPAVSAVEQELAQFTFLGFLEKDRKKTVFLARNKELFLVKKGDRIANRYEATSITADALTIRVLGGESTEIVIPLVEQQTLRPSSRQGGTGSAPQAPRPGRAPVKSADD